MENIPSPDSAVILPTWSRESTPLEAIANSPGLIQTFLFRIIFILFCRNIYRIRSAWKIPRFWNYVRKDISINWWRSITVNSHRNDTCRQSTADRKSKAGEKTDGDKIWFDFRERRRFWRWSSSLGLVGKLSTLARNDCTSTGTGPWSW